MKLFTASALIVVNRKGKKTEISMDGTHVFADTKELALDKYSEILRKKYKTIDINQVVITEIPEYEESNKKYAYQVFLNSQFM